MDGADVVLVLKQVCEEIWAVGIDDTYSSMMHQATIETVRQRLRHHLANGGVH